MKETRIGSTRITQQKASHCYETMYLIHHRSEGSLTMCPPHLLFPFPCGSVTSHSILIMLVVDGILLLRIPGSISPLLAHQAEATVRLREAHRPFVDGALAANFLLFLFDELQRSFG